MNDQYDEQDDIQSEDAPIGTDKVIAEAVRLAHEKAWEDAKTVHLELVAEFANEVTSLRIAGKATPQALAAIREKYAARGMGQLDRQPDPTVRGQCPAPGCQERIRSGPDRKLPQRHAGSPGKT